MSNIQEAFGLFAQKFQEKQQEEVELIKKRIELLEKGE
jgi:hypothetical protein